MLACFVGSAIAQASDRPIDENIGTISNSPFSRLGLGDEFLSGGSRQQALGGSGVAAPSSDNLNLINPAGLFYNRVANIEFDTRLGFRTLTDGKNKQSFGNWTPTHISITVPVARPVTVSVGIRQFSALDYHHQTTSIVDGDSNNLPYSLESYGLGSLTHVYMAAGVKIYKGFTAGLTATYWTGTLKNRSVSSVILADGQSVSADQTVRQRFSDIQLKPGAAWRGTLPGATAMRFGAGFVTDLPTSLGTRTESLLSRRLNGTFTTTDTLYTGRPEQVQAPVTWQGGLMAEKVNHWSVMADVGHTRWDETQSTILQPNLKNTFKATAGLEYLPNYLSNRYLNLVTYRLGLRWQQMPYVADGKQLNDFSASAGLGIPILRKEARYTRPILNATIQVGRRGSVARAGLSETYVNFTLGVVLNDNLWFVRYKVE